MWYTLTGNFGNLLPIDYWSKTLIRKYHARSLDLKLDKNSRKEKRLRSGKASNVCNKTWKSTAEDEMDEEVDSYYYDDESVGSESDVECSSDDGDGDDDGDDEEEDDIEETDNNCAGGKHECDDDDPLEFDEIDDDELKEQLDMHSMILSRSMYNGDEPIITAEQVLNEIDSIIKLEVRYKNR